ncbi:MAG: cytochrome c550 [marine bacterium B5-7]|nr:MAG: cytochrome c550 [marine bacterium B5-7]
MTYTVYLDGRFIPEEKARVSAMDRGFLLGDGIYEVMPMYHGVPFHLDYHFDRLSRSLAAVSIENPLTRDDYRHICESLYHHHDSTHQSIYFQITRGAYETRTHYFPDEKADPTLFAFAKPLELHGLSTLSKGLAAVTHADLRWQRCDIKVISLLANVMAREYSKQQHVDEAILLRDGIVTEGSHTNVFVVKNDEVFTHPSNEHILGGITRQVTIQMLKDLNIPCHETLVPEADLLSADEIWLTSTTKMVAPVLQLNQHAVGDGKPGEIWQQTASAFIRYIEGYATHDK